MDLKKFIFVIRKPDGQEYEMAAISRDETDAEDEITPEKNFFKDLEVDSISK